MIPDEIAVLGASLRPIAQNLLNQSQEKDIKRIWYQGEEPYFDVFFDLKNDEIVWFQFTLRGQVLIWDARYPSVQSGKTNELKVNDVTYYPASKTIDIDNHPNLDFIYLVKAILQTKAKDPLFSQVLKIFDGT